MKEIVLPMGLITEKTFTYLKKKAEEYKEPVCASFNGNYVDSTMTEDEVYQSISGKTKYEYQKSQKEYLQKIEAARKAYEDLIPELKKEYLREAATAYYFDKTKYNDFADVLEPHLRSIYCDNNIRNMFAICKVLADNKDNETKAIIEAKKVFEDQGHSGYTAGITASLVALFSPYFGIEFYQKAYL